VLAKPESSGKSTQARSKKKPSRTAERRPTSTATVAAIGAAEILDTEQTGLHGHASFYGHGFQGRRTATGERFDVRAFTGASNRFPLGTMVAVRRLDNDRCAIVKINDRMHAKHQRRVIDVSRGVADYLGMVSAGVILVRVAPLKAGWQGMGEGACLAAFEAPPVTPDAATRPRLPGFGDDFPD